MAALDQRRLVPEMLDDLPASDPRAQASRRDLVWINSLMFHAKIMATALEKVVSQPPRRIVEIGCGDGALMAAIAKLFARKWPGVELVLLDRLDLVPENRLDAFRELGWKPTAEVGDVFEWMDGAGDGAFDLVCCNLFLHHFEGESLARLLASIHRIGRAFVAAEPERGRLGLAGCAMLPLIGVNGVTRHDAAASVRAGFAGDEITRAWPAGARGTTAERQVGPFTHLFSHGEARAV